ncbi:MAG: alpha/beta hydrolase [Polyangiaceae bacterium]
MPEYRTRFLRIARRAAYAVAAGVVFFVGARSLARKVMFPGGASPFPDDLARTWKAERLRFRTRDDLAAEAAYFVARGSSPTLVFFHGNAEAAADNLAFGAALASRGFGVVLAEYRGYGGLSGRPSERNLYDDAECLLALLAERRVGSESLVLVGRSLGTGVATEMASRGRGRALVLVSPYTSMHDMASRFVPGVGPIAIADAFDTASKLPALTIPITIVHGEDDEVVPFSMGRALAEASPRARLIPLPRTGHNDIRGLDALVADALRDDSGAGTPPTRHGK